MGARATCRTLPPKKLNPAGFQLIMGIWVPWLRAVFAAAPRNSLSATWPTPAYAPHPSCPAFLPPGPASTSSLIRGLILKPNPQQLGGGGHAGLAAGSSPRDGCDLESAHQVCQHPARPASVLGSDSLVPIGQLGAWTQGGHVGEGPRPRALGCLLAHTPNPPSLRPRHKA